MVVIGSIFSVVLINLVFLGFGPRHVRIDHDQTLNKRFIDYLMSLGSFKIEMLLRNAKVNNYIFSVSGPAVPLRRFGRATIFFFCGLLKLQHWAPHFV